MCTMMDMGMGNMNGMKMGGMAGMDMFGVDGMKEKDMPAGMKMDSQNVESMDMSHMNMSSNGATQEKQTGDHTHQMTGGMEMGSSNGTTPFPQPGPNTMPIVAKSATEVKNVEAHLKPSNQVHLQKGPQVSSVPMQVSERLNDPGIGLNGNGRRVLTYTDLRARYRGVDGRPPTREIELHLTGNMELVVSPARRE